MAERKKENPFDIPIRFGTDGWRGRIARDFTFENVRKVAQAIGDYAKSQKKLAAKPITIGFDNRFQSDAFAEEIARVLAANKLKPVILKEVLPTPALTYLTDKNQSVGIMVTASHNPADYNGIKVKLRGRAAPVEITEEIEKHLGKGYAVAPAKIARNSFQAPYLSYVKAKGNAAKIAKALRGKIVVDYMYGCGIGLFEKVLPPKKIVPIHDGRDPLFSGLHPEPVESNLAPLAKAVRENKALAGIAFDGDADRFGLVDEKGRYVTPCQVFPLFVDFLVQNKKIKGKVVQSVSMGFLAERVARKYGLDFEEVPVGFKHIADRMVSEGAAFGGEESGGYAWKGTLPERDGLLSGLLLLEIMTTLKKPLSAILAELEKEYGKSFYTRRDLRLAKTVASKQAFTDRILKKLPKKLVGVPIQRSLSLDGVKIYDENGHWLALRPSGTEPLLRIYAESDSAQRTEDMLEVGRKWCRHLL